MMAMPEKENEQKIMLWRGAKRIVGSLFYLGLVKEENDKAKKKVKPRKNLRDDFAGKKTETLAARVK